MLHSSFTDTSIPRTDEGIVRTQQVMGTTVVYRYHNARMRNEDAVHRSRVCPDPKCLDCQYSSKIIHEQVVENVAKADIDYSKYVMYFPLNVTALASLTEEAMLSVVTRFQAGEVVPKSTHKTMRHVLNKVFDPVNNEIHHEFLKKHLGGSVVQSGKTDTDTSIKLEDLEGSIGFRGFDEYFCKELSKFGYDPAGTARVKLSNPLVTIPYSVGVTNMDENAELVLRIIAVYARSLPFKFASMLPNLYQCALSNLSTTLNRAVDDFRAAEVNTVTIITELKFDPTTPRDVFRVGESTPGLRVTYKGQNAETLIYVYTENGTRRVGVHNSVSHGGLTLISNKRPR